MRLRAVIHADLDAFFASVEIKKRPELKGRPVIVGADGDPSKRGVVSAASYEARSLGVTAGMPLRRAYKLCPEGAFLPVDFEAYEKESERFMSILKDLSPLVESFGIDEAFIEMAPSGADDPFPAALEAAREIKRRVKKELGLTVSIGIGPNKLLSKLACDMHKPDGFFVIREKEVDHIMRGLPVRELWGVGEKTENRLRDLGVNTAGELQRLPIQHLELNFGPERGRTLYEHARGIDDSPVVPFHEPDSVSREVTFEEDTSDAYVVRETLYALTGDVTARLKALGYKGRTVTIKIRYYNFRTVTHSRPLDSATDSLNDIWAAASRLLESLEGGRQVRLVGVKVAGLEGKKENR